MRKIVLFNQNQIPESLSNICFKRICNSEELKLKLLETKDDTSFLNLACQLTGLYWKIVKSDDELVQLSYTDTLGNVKYLKALKEKTKFTKEQIDKATNILIQEGVKKHHAYNVLLNVYYALTGKPLSEE